MKNKLFAAMTAAAIIATLGIAGRWDAEEREWASGIRKQEAQIVGYVIQTADGNIWECDVDEDCIVSFRGDAIVDVRR